jgi:hypothetical protein
LLEKYRQLLEDLAGNPDRRLAELVKPQLNLRS